MQTISDRNLHIPVFFLVMSAITNVYITQPVLPIYSAAGWDGVAGLGITLLLVPLSVGIVGNRTSTT